MRALAMAGLLLLAALLLPGASMGEKIETLEFDEIQVLDLGEVEEEASWSLTRITGRMHPALVHFPIAWLALVLLVDGAALLAGQKGLIPWGPWLLGLTLLAFLPAAVSGFLAYGEYQEPDPVAQQHRLLALTALALSGAALVLRLSRRNDLQGVLRWGYLALIGAANALIGLAGHLGGRLVFGEDHLPF